MYLQLSQNCHFSLFPSGWLGQSGSLRATVTRFVGCTSHLCDNCAIVVSQMNCYTVHKRKVTEHHKTSLTFSSARMLNQVHSYVVSTWYQITTKTTAVQKTSIHSLRSHVHPYSHAHHWPKFKHLAAHSWLCYLQLQFAKVPTFIV